MAIVEQILTSDNADLYRLILDIPIPGYSDFITPWLIQETGFGLVMGTGLYRTILVDPGPACGIPSLLECLSQLGVRRLDYVLLTHVHIDHAGGIADLASAYPALKVVAHDRGRVHLLDPARLWEASVQTLGDVAKAFGPISPLPERNLLPQFRGVEGITVIDTPGHAPHHQSYLFRCGERDVLFSGEAAGVFVPRNYLRPATPPRFFYDVSQNSLDRLRAVSASAICYGHCGYSHDVSHLLQAAGAQLALWRDVVGDVATGAAGAKAPGGRPMAPADPEAQVDACLERLLAADPNLSEFADLDPDIRDREVFYLKSSIRGFMG